MLQLPLRIIQGPYRTVNGTVAEKRASITTKSETCRVLCAAVVPLLLWLPLVAVAAVPGGSDAGRLGERFTPQPTPLSRPAAEIAVPAFRGEGVPAGAEGIRFELTGITVQGATVFDGERFAELYADQIGSEIALETVYEIAARVTALYDRAGYLLSRAIVPPQTIEGGRVVLQVVEGYIDEVMFEDIPPSQGALFDHYRAQVLQSRPLHRDVLERYLLLANDLPGMRFKSVLRPSATTPGASTLYLKAERSNWRGSFQLDNRGAETSGPWQAVLEGQWFGLGEGFDSTALRLATNPDNVSELRYAFLSHERVISPEGWLIGANLTLSNTAPGDASLRVLDTDSRYVNVGARASYPLIRTRERNLVLNGSLAWLDSETEQLGTLLSQDRLAVLSLGASYDRSDTLGGGGISLLSLTLTQGLGVFGAKSTSRALAGPVFTYLQGQFRRNQVIDDRFGANLRLSAQLSDDPLPSTEQLGLGGEYSVRGYEPSEWTGDRGFSSALELTYRPDLDIRGDAQLYGFADFGKVWRKTVLVTDDRSDEARSLGLGVRRFFPGDLSLNLEAARQLNRDSRGHAPGWQAYLRVSVGF